MNDINKNGVSKRFIKKMSRILKKRFSTPRQKKLTALMKKYTLTN